MRFIVPRSYDSKLLSTH